jgi:threonine aldolase
MRRLCEIAAAQGVPVHLDGARVFNAAVALDVPSGELAGRCDSVMIDLSKGLCAPYGSLLCGSAELIARAVTMRQRVGGNTRQIGHMAASGIIALETMIERLGEDHANARRLAECIHRVGPELVDLDLVQTNMVMVSSAPLGLSAAQLAERLAAAGVRCLPVDSGRIRLVTHRDVDSERIERAAEAIGALLESLL